MILMIFIFEIKLCRKKLKNYTLRFIDNSLNSINLGVIEHILKSNTDKEKDKS